LNSINVAYLMLATRHITPQLCDVCGLDFTHNLHDLMCGLSSMHRKQLVQAHNAGLVLQSAESSLRDMQTLVQQEAGVLLDRQRITIEGIPTSNSNHAYALLSLACPFLCMLHFHLHLCIIVILPSLPCMSMTSKSCSLHLLNMWLL